MYINQVSAAIPLASSKPLQNKKEQVSFKANYQQIINEGKNLINKDLSLSGFKKVITYLKNKILPSQKMPIVENALAFYFTGMYTKKEFFERLAEKTMSGEYIDPKTKDIANVIRRLDSLGITKSWEFPEYRVMFYNGNLDNITYHEIREKIKDPNMIKLNDYQKRDLLNDLAESSYHTEDITFDLSFKSRLETDGVDIEGADDLGVLQRVEDFDLPEEFELPDSLDLPDSMDIPDPTDCDVGFFEHVRDFLIDIFT